MHRSLLLAAALICLPGCASAPPPAPIPTPAPPFQAVGLLELSFSAGGLSASRVRPLTLGSQALTEQARGLQLDPLSVSVVSTGTRGVDGQRYISATYRVRNADADGTPSPAARSNLTLLAVSAGDTLGGSPFRAVTTFAGSAVPQSVIRSVLPTHAMKFDPLSAQPVLSPGGEDLQVFTEAEVASGSIQNGSAQPLSYADLGVNTVFPYGYTVRTASGGRTLSANPAAGQFDGQVTLAVKVPLQPDDAGLTPPEGIRRDPWTFRIVVLVVQDSQTRVTQSLEEQGSNAPVAQRAASVAATQVTVLPGSTYPAGVTAVASRCVNKVRSAGLATDADATYLVQGVCP
ncbi:hypothetical protein [Deinococcus kurensis]|uniref:hypothetical protein n=1 Tax=Deinococcus kurensis TaxID=2662757 RepID=UPI0012D2AF14|nr:hypothetical protein [Deinococcus kurensis]